MRVITGGWPGRSECDGAGLDAYPSVRGFRFAERVCRVCGVLSRLVSLPVLGSRNQAFAASPARQRSSPAAAKVLDRLRRCSFFLWPLGNILAGRAAWCAGPASLARHLTAGKAPQTSRPPPGGRLSGRTPGRSHEPIVITVTGRLGMTPRLHHPRRHRRVELRLAVEVPGRGDTITRWSRSPPSCLAPAPRLGPQGDRVTVIADDLTRAWLSTATTASPRPDQPASRDIAAPWLRHPAHRLRRPQERPRQRRQRPATDLPAGEQADAQVLAGSLLTRWAGGTLPAHHSLALFVPSRSRRSSVMPTQPDHHRLRVGSPLTCCRRPALLGFIPAAASWSSVPADRSSASRSRCGSTCRPADGQMTARSPRTPSLCWPPAVHHRHRHRLRPGRSSPLADAIREASAGPALSCATCCASKGTLLVLSVRQPLCCHLRRVLRHRWAPAAVLSRCLRQQIWQPRRPDRHIARSPAHGRSDAPRDPPRPAIAARLITAPPPTAVRAGR